MQRQGGPPIGQATFSSLSRDSPSTQQEISLQLFEKNKETRKLSNADCTCSVSIPPTQSVACPNVRWPGWGEHRSRILGRGRERKLTCLHPLSVRLRKMHPSLTDPSYLLQVIYYKFFYPTLSPYGSKVKTTPHSQPPDASPSPGVLPNCEHPRFKRSSGSSRIG